MRTFTYRTVDADGNVSSGRQDAPDLETLSSTLARQGRFLVDSTEQQRAGRKPNPVAPRPAAPGGQGARRRRTRYSCSRLDLINFTISLQSLVEAGVPLVTGLHYLLPQIARRKLRACIAEVVTDLEQGSAFSEALRRHPLVFPDLYVEIVGGGEESGKLDAVLKELVANLEWTHDMVGAVRKALAYPVFLVVAMVGVTSAMLMFVVPRFTGIFEKMRAKMPTPTRILDVASKALLHHPAVFLAVVASVPLVVILLRLSPRGRMLLARGLRKLPLVGRVVRTIAVSRLCHGLALLLDAGVNLSRALRLGEAIAGDPVVGASVREAHRRLERGATLEEAFQKLPAIPELVAFMVATGEKTGRLSYTLAKAGAQMSRQARDGVGRLVSLLEPALIVGLGLVVGGISGCMLLGMYSLMEAVRNAP